MPNEILIATKKISQQHKPFIIAEMSGNHQQSLKQALAMVEAAAKAGADAIKLQTYTADTMTFNIDRDEFKVLDKNSLWYGRHLYELYQEAHTPWAWHQPIMDKAKELGIICFSTPFDETAIDFLEELNVPAYKIASFENTDVRLIRKAAQTGKPIIVSTGMAGLEEISLMVKTLRENGAHHFALLKCTSAYPASPMEINLRTIPHLAEQFDCQVGLSDHTLGIGTALASVALGATVIEKHFTLNRSDGGVDAAFSLEPHELAMLVEESRNAWQALGSVTYQSGSSEEKSKQFRRSLYFDKNKKAGEVITDACIRSARPGLGLPPRYWDDLIGRKIKVDVAVGDPVSWDLLKERQDEFSI